MSRRTFEMVVAGVLLGGALLIILGVRGGPEDHYDDVPYLAFSIQDGGVPFGRYERLPGGVWKATYYHGDARFEHTSFSRAGARAWLIRKHEERGPYGDHQ